MNDRQKRELAAQLAGLAFGAFMVLGMAWGVARVARVLVG
ncbi:hypothetical protein SAMN05216577_119108 [Pseudomonas citronellolis]|jgi:hypothetical protein|uniref:Uncharacterized protein n=1 Tax=Pseudomonas citronellolis TaxID=53408 RepID=A0AAQ1HPZ8_9PSED|nr:hypothetical protein PcP3B5_35720 [Pseudomonas citronellolis]MCP1603843.1 hypothetical protein [Pseudomonas citronellolis]MCP1640584.1 hypothetical protein [Pseudomonas citronellolis]MCP1654507.1 hypothetical protein [Pseudomonas citronellolis]MCP1663504.1 hypothetical protein [Pseudomonas citronellolis]